MEIHVDLDSERAKQARQLAIELLTARLTEGGPTLGPMTQTTMGQALTDVLKNVDFAFLLVFWQTYIASTLAGLCETYANEAGNELDSAEVVQQLALALERS